MSIQVKMQSKSKEKPTYNEGKSIPRRRDKRSRDNYYDDEPKSKFKKKGCDDDTDDED